MGAASAAQEGFDAREFGVQRAAKCWVLWRTAAVWRERRLSKNIEQSVPDVARPSSSENQLDRLEDLPSAGGPRGRDHQHQTRGVLDDLLGDTPEQRVTEPLSPVATHDY